MYVYIYMYMYMYMHIRTCSKLTLLNELPISETPLVKPACICVCVCMYVCVYACMFECVHLFWDTAFSTCACVRNVRHTYNVRAHKACTYV